MTGAGWRALIDLQNYIRTTNTVAIARRKFLYKRATDLIVPPIDAENLYEFKIEDHDLKWIMTDLDGGLRTGCVKASSPSKGSRSAMLVYRGRTVACMYSSKSLPDTRPTEESTQSMFADLEAPDTFVQIYDLPENVVLAMSALFRGYPVPRTDNYDARGYWDYICGWLENQNSTACLIVTSTAISPASDAFTCLGYVYKGQFCGAFYVQEQQFTTDKNFVYELLKRSPGAHIEVSVLPPP